MIALFIKHVKFFKLHQSALIISMARKIKLVEINEIDDKMMVIILEGQLKYKG